MRKMNGRKKNTGTGSIGASRPGAKGLTGQDPSASSSSNCPETVHRADPRPCAQSATGMNSKKNMTDKKTQQKITGTGGIGAPRPGAEGLNERDPSASSSDNRNSNSTRVAIQACAAENMTGNNSKKVSISATVSSTEDGTESDGSYQTPRGKKVATSLLARKRARPSPTMESNSKRRTTSDGRTNSDVEEEEEAYFLNPEVEAPPPSKGAKRLPTDEERAANLRHLPTANLAAMILENAKTVEKVASASGNLKGTYKRFLREAAGNSKACVTEISKRNSSASSEAALEQENLQLKARIFELESKCAKLESNARVTQPSPKPKKAPKGNTSGEPNGADRICPSPPSPIGSTIRTRASSAKEPSQGCDFELMSHVVQVVKALAEEVNELRQDIRRMQQKNPQLREMDQNVQLHESHNNNTKAAGTNLATSAQFPSLAKVAPGLRNPMQLGADSNSSNATSVPTAAWTTVAGRKAKRSAKQKEADSNKASTAQKAPPQQQGKARNAQSLQKPKQQVRPPRRSAVTITVAPGSKKTYAEAMAAAKTKINLQEMDIADIRVRRSITGGLILEIPGKDTSAKADNLAERLRQVFKDEGEIRVSRPTKKVEISISGLDDSITPQEVTAAIAGVGNCPVSDVKTGAIRRWASGMGSVWAQCPVIAAKRIAATGRIRIGWISAKVEILPPRPLQCFRCLEPGHVKQQCKSEKDRTGQCFTCGETGHKAKECSGTPRCSLCADRRMDAKHRLGSRACTSMAVTQINQGVRRGTRSLTRCSVATTPAPNERNKQGESRDNPGPTGSIGKEGTQKERADTQA